MAQGPARVASGSSAWVDITGKPSTFPPSAHTQAWSTITSTPTTLSGYGITDAQPLDADLTAFAGLASATGWLHNDGAGVLAWSTPSKSDIGLGSVENTPLSTWTGSANLSTVGTISSGTWHGTALADTYIASAAAWNAKVSFPGFGTTAGTAAVGNDARLSDARTPTAHNQAWSTITSTPTTLAGYAISDAQPLDSDLTSIAALATTSFGRSLLTQADAAAARTTIGAGTSSFDGAYASLTGIPSTFTPAAHNQAWSTITSTPTTLSGYGITDAQGLDSDLTALAGLSTTGLVARTGSGTAATRTITGTADQVTVTNGDGVAGNPTLSLPQSISTTSTPQFTRIGIGQASDGTRAVSITGDSYTSGSVLVGTTTAGRKLTVSGNGIQVVGTTGTSGALAAEGTTVSLQADSAAATRFLIDAGGANAAGYVALNGGATSGYIQLAIGGVERMRVATAGGVRLNAYGAGTLVTDSSGNVTASSDRRLKNVSGKFTRGLDVIMQIQPKVFTWKPESGMNTDDVNVGFIAQDVQDAIPEAVGTMKTTDYEEDDAATGKKARKSKREAAEYLTLSDRPIIAALVNAVKELKADNDTLRARVSALENGKAAK